MMGILEWLRKLKLPKKDFALQSFVGVVSFGFLSLVGWLQQLNL